MKIQGVAYVQGRNAYSDPDGTKYGIAIHNTSNTASAAAEASYATRRTDGVSSHLYVDGAQVIQSLDTASRAGHAGSSNGNNHAVAVEIVGLNSRARDWWLNNVAWDELSDALAQVCRAYGISVRRATVAEMKSNPKVRAFYSHNDMRLAWGGTTHNDPGDNFPWDRLFGAVAAALGGNSSTSDGGSMTIQQDIYYWARVAVTGRDSDGHKQDDPFDGTPIVGIAHIWKEQQEVNAALAEQLDTVIAKLDALSAQVASTHP